MTDERPTIVVEVRGPQGSGVTTLAELIKLELQAFLGLRQVRGPGPTRMRFELQGALKSASSLVEVREAEPDDRDTELASLRQERDRLRADVERLERVDREARFLVDRLRDYEADEEDSVRQWEGHVSPSLSRLAALLGVRR